MFVVVAFACCLFAVEASAQKRPKPALKESDARRVVAEAPGFALRKGAVKVKEVSPAGASPVTVSAGVTIAFRLVRVEDERASDSDEWSKATVNLPIRQGAQIWVTDGGHADLQFDDGSELEIRQIFSAEDFGDNLTPELKEQEEKLRAQSAAKR